MKTHQRSARIFFLLTFFASLFNAATAQTKEDTVSLTTQTGILKGSWFTPANKTSYPALILVPGSGPTDRYGNSPLGVTANSYKMIAEALGEQGIATLLIDKRGIAQSSSAMKREEDVSIDIYAIDVMLWTEQLRKNKAVTEIFIAGHSEGSLIGMVAAAALKTIVKGYISIAGPARNISEIIVEQYSKQFPALALVVDSLFTRMKNAQPLENVPPSLFSIFRPSVQPYMMSWIKYSPCDVIKKLSVPVLIIQGATDIQVEPKEGEMLKQCDPSAELLMLAGMNHVLKTAPLDRKENIAAYSMPDLPLKEGLVSGIAGFIKKNSK